MELLQLMYFCDAAEEENFSHTAQKYQVPPSNISQSVKRLEAELGVKLFDRSANRIILNTRGRAFYQKTKAALSLLADAKEEAADREDMGEIRLYVQTNRRIVMQTVQAFREFYPQVTVMATHHVPSDLGEFHLAIADESLMGSGYSRRKLLEEDIYLAMSRKNLLAQRQTFSMSELKEQPFISLGPGNSMHQITMDACHRWGFVPRIAIQSDDPFYIRKCVELDLGMALIPGVSWKGQIAEDICLKKLEGIQRNTYVYWDDNKYIPACTRAFLRMLLEAFEAENIR